MVRFKCPKCGWAVTQYRETSKDMICLRCGFRGKMEDFENGEVTPEIEVRCPVDGYQNVRYLIRENLYKCLRCGHKGTRKEFIKKMKIKA